jgi:hypothetical protein
VIRGSDGNETTQHFLIVKPRVISERLIMSEVEIVGVLGIAGTIVGTLAGAYVSYHLEGKREERRVKAEEWKSVVDQVYSPLIFDLDLVQKNTLQILGTLGTVLTKHPTSFPEAASPLVTGVSKILSQHKQSQVLEDILKKKSRLIKPTNLWLDLFRFYISLQTIEELCSYVSSGIFDKNPAGLIVALKSAAKIGEILSSAIPYLIDQMKKFVVLTAKEPHPQSYTCYFTELIMTNIDQQIQSISKALVGD